MKRRMDKPNNKMLKPAFKDGRRVGWRTKEQKASTYKKSLIKNWN